MSSTDTGDRSVRLPGIPLDLVAVAAFLAVALGVVFVAPPGSAPYLFAAVPLLLFVPGYVLLAVAFPRRPDRNKPIRRGITVVEAGPTWTDRLVLSFPVSVGVVPVVGGVLLALGRPFDPTTVATVLGALVGVGLVAAWIRRVRIPVDERLDVPAEGAVTALKGRWLGTGSAGELIATVALVASAVLLVSSIALAAGGPAGGTSYTRLMLLSENESGELTAGGFPTEIVQHRAVPVVANVQNSEGTTTDYTLVVRHEHLANGSNEVRNASVLTSEQFTLEPGETVNRSVTVTSRDVGADQRVSFYLYRGESPADVGPATAYRHAYMSITVRPPTDG